MRSLRTKLVLCVALATLIACAPGGSESVVSVAIDGGDRSLAVGQTLALTATVVTVGGASDAVEWASSESSVASVDAAGVLSALAVGTTDVTARSASDATKSDTVVVTVGPAGALAWTRQFGTTEFDGAAAVATDASGHVYVAGNTVGVLEGSSAGSADAYVRSYDGVGALRWTRQFGTSSGDVARGVATDGAGHVYVAGYTAGALEGVSAGDIDGWLRSYDGDGTLRWTRQFGTIVTEFAFAVATDANGNVYVVGDTNGDFEGASAGGVDAYVRSYDGDGTHRWTRQFGTVTSDIATAVATDPAGNVYVAGYTYGSLEGTVAGSIDTFVRSYDGAGTLRWTRQFGAGGFDLGTGIAADGGGNVYVVGATDGDLEGLGAGGDDAFVRAYDQDGAHRWTRQFGTGTSDDAQGVAVDANGNVFVAGYTFGSLEGANAGGLDTFVRSFGPDGAYRWARQFGTSSDDVVGGIASDATGSVYLVGHTYGALTGTSAGGADAFLRKYGP